jgi:hypothetical protein
VTQKQEAISVGEDESPELLDEMERPSSAGLGVGGGGGEEAEADDDDGGIRKIAPPTVTPARTPSPELIQVLSLFLSLSLLSPSPLFFFYFLSLPPTTAALSPPEL